MPQDWSQFRIRFPFLISLKSSISCCHRPSPTDLEKYRSAIQFTRRCCTMLFTLGVGRCPLPSCPTLTDACSLCNHTTSSLRTQQQQLKP
ncbi:hypothetical protein KC19_VG330100 [Ceratodon purpureus]|uniref:Uncharacterized protein n=1 Tax=Ceratodon purpureus TaxID=3225 RepID=A0A8T0HWZ4_CERPU|nr:hypothetical protein KC19_VG330100 [Ceratodon purpureus]